ncbi:MAG: hypothetical protein FH748_16550 [Balneolaceae bacterium]|nr:hypothetical protein [Balneolaceae bacterium]
MKKITNFIILLLFVQSWISKTDTEFLDFKTFTKQELSEDLNILETALREAHPGLYLYTDSTDLADSFKHLKSELENATDVFTFSTQLFKVLNQVHCGHIEVSWPESEVGKFFSSTKFFPDPIVIINDNVFINNPPDSKSSLTFGDQILSINGVDINKILNSIEAFVPGDGTSGTNKYRQIEDYFYLYLAFEFPERDHFSVEILSNDTGQKITQDVQLKGHDETIEKYEARIKRYETDKNFSFEVLSDSVGLITIRSFDARYRNDAAIDSVFHNIRSQGIKSVILDLRGNRGGSRGYKEYLASYFIDEATTLTSATEINEPTYSFLEYTADSVDSNFYTFADKHTANEQGKYIQTVTDKIIPKPNAYTGQLAVLVDGYCFSACSSFASFLYDHNGNSVFIGEETIGGFKGHTGGYYTEVTLPNSHLRIKIPLVKFTENVSSFSWGRGLVPHHNIESQLEDLVNGNDAPLNVAVEIVGRQKGKAKN